MWEGVPCRHIILRRSEQNADLDFFGAVMIWRRRQILGGRGHKSKAQPLILGWASFTR